MRSRSAAGFSAQLGLVDGAPAGAVGRQQRGVLGAERLLVRRRLSPALVARRALACAGGRRHDRLLPVAMAARPRPDAELVRLCRAGDGSGPHDVARRPGRRQAAPAPLRGGRLVALYRADGHRPARGRAALRPRKREPGRRDGPACHRRHRRAGRCCASGTPRHCSRRPQRRRGPTRQLPCPRRPWIRAWSLPWSGS